MLHSLIHTQVRWISMAVISLAISGIYSIILVAMRTPLITSFIGNDSELKIHLFRTALIVHVNLSVLVWMLAVACYIWQEKINSLYHNTAYYLYAAGIVLLTISPIFGGTPYLNNYIPMLDNLGFIIGLAFIFCSSLIMAGSAFFSLRSSEVFSICLILGAIILAFLLAADDALVILTQSFDYQQYYEYLFWGAGHIMQFLYTQLAIIAWWRLAGNEALRDVYSLLLWLNSAFALCGLSCYLIASGEMDIVYSLFTSHMQYFAGIVPSIIAMLLIFNIKKQYKSLAHANLAAVGLSFALFFCGGIIAIMIGGHNVTIPAHYHGSVVGVSVALMGLIYHIIFAQEEEKRARIKQLYIYSFGQLLHIAGLAWSGGYGVLRKTPGDNFPLDIKIAMGLMGLGGLVAIIGGLMFVLICGRKLFFIPKVIIYNE